MRGYVVMLSAVVAFGGEVLVCADSFSRADFYIARLDSDRAAVRRAAVRALGCLSAPAVVPRLIEALSDQDAHVRAEAAKVLGMLRAKDALTPLLARLSDRESTVRFYAAYALGEIGDPVSVHCLLPLLGDPEWVVRDQVAWALRIVADESIAPDLVRLLAHGSIDATPVRWLLQCVAPRACIAELVKLLAEPDVEMRLRAVETLGDLGSREAVNPLLVALEDTDARVRLSAVKGLVAVGDDSLDAVFQRLAARDADEPVRRAAHEASLELSLRGNLVAYWSFDDEDPTIATDVTRRGIDGKIVGCEVVPGISGAALAFREGTYIELGKPPEMPVGQRALTVMAWVRSETPNGVVVARGGAYRGFSLHIRDGVAGFGIHRLKDGPSYIAAGGENIVGRWVHLAGVIGAERVDVYVDGRRAGTAATPGYLPGECGQGMQIGFDAGTSAVEITDHFVGIIDEVKVFQAAFDEGDLVKHCRITP